VAYDFVNGTPPHPVSWTVWAQEKAENSELFRTVMGMVAQWQDILWDQPEIGQDYPEGERPTVDPLHAEGNIAQLNAVLSLARQQPEAEWSEGVRLIVRNERFIAEQYRLLEKEFQAIESRVQREWPEGLTERMPAWMNANPWNTVINVQGQPHFIDWDMAHMVPRYVRLWDIVGTDWANRPPANAQGRYAYDAQEVVRVLEAVLAESRHPLKDVEIGAIPAFARLAFLNDMRQRLEALIKGGLRMGEMEAAFADATFMRLDLLKQLDRISGREWKAVEAQVREINEARKAELNMAQAEQVAPMTLANLAPESQDWANWPMRGLLFATGLSPIHELLGHRFAGRLLGLPVAASFSDVLRGQVRPRDPPAPEQAIFHLAGILAHLAVALAAAVPYLMAGILGSDPSAVPLAVFLAYFSIANLAVASLEALSSPPRRTSE